MKEIGSKFKEKREEIGIKLEEVSNDLEVTIAQLENLEDGNVNAFKDVFFLKDLVKKYATYLNIDEDEVLEDFNDFIFNYTSKIPIEEIEEKVKEIVKEEEQEYKKKINSPYTAKKAMKMKLKPIYLYIVIGIIITTSAVLIINAIISSRAKENTQVSYIMKGD